MSHMSGPYPRMPGESIPGKETRGTATVVATDLSNKDAYRAPEESKAETYLANNITEPVKTNKDLESMKVFEVEAQPKSDPTNELESPVTQFSLLFHHFPFHFFFSVATLSHRRSVRIKKLI